MYHIVPSAELDSPIKYLQFTSQFDIPCYASACGFACVFIDPCAMFSCPFALKKYVYGFIKFLTEIIFTQSHAPSNERKQ